MKISKVDPDCELFGRKNGFWVSCPEKLIDPIMALVGEKARSDFESYGREAFLSNRLATSNPGLFEMGCYYFMIAEDCSEAIPMPAYYPHSGQWNAYNPFLEVDPVEEVSTMEELKDALKRLSDGRFRKHRENRFIGTEDEFVITNAPVAVPKKNSKK